MNLDESQKMALNDLSQKLARAASKINSARDALEPDVSNSFGILGPRGAGKSTLLHELSGDATLKKKIKVVPPIDCSVIPPDVAPGAAILLHILNQLKEPEGGGALSHARQKLEGLAERYAENTEAFRRLNLELASSQGDYKHAVLSGMRHRFSLPEELRDWLRDTLRILDQDAFLVLLDDFDLVEADGVRRWIYSLLDEFRQRRLLFVLTADYYRLEHLGFNPRLEFDDKTGRSFVDKLLPVQNRCDLERWALKSRGSFSLHGAGREPVADDKQVPLGQLVERYSLGCKVQGALLGRLLPGWPRGLVNLYRDLESQLAAGPTAAPPDEAEYRRFLSILASCRGEYLLARKLKSAPFSNWPRLLNFGHADLSVEDWRTAVDVALGRTDPGVELRPLPLYPVSSLQRPQSERHKLELERGGKRETPLVPAVVLLNPSEPDRLRHDDLRTLPLQDAQESSLPYWSELLLDYSFLAFDKEEATRNRIRFMEDWTPVSQRLKHARFNAKLARWQLRQFFENSPAPIPHSALLWMTWHVMEEPTVEIGWPAVLSGLRGARDPMLSDQLADLLIGSSNLKGPLPAIGDAKSLAFIPSELWAMVVLIDSLDRCPWRAFSIKSGWLLSTYLKLAVAFVRSAYIHALVATRVLSTEGVTSAQNRILTTLTTLDPSSLLELPEEGMLEILQELFSEDVPAPLCQAEDPLSISARAFLESSVYRGVVELQPSPE